MSDGKKQNNGAALDNQEPTVKSERSPLWIFVLTGLLLYLSMGFLAEHAGGFNNAVYEPYPSYAYVKRAQGKLGGEGPIERGQKVYETKGCIACHQATGAGVPGQFPPLVGSDWVNAEGPERIIRIVLHGAAGPITVSGQNFNGAMPPWKGVLTDQEIADVLSFVRNHWGNKASIVPLKEVKAVSDKEGARATPWAPTELMSLPVKQ